MAACGLQPGRKGSIPGHNGFGDTRYSRNSTSIGIPNDKSKYAFQTIFKIIRLVYKKKFNSP